MKQLAQIRQIIYIIEFVKKHIIVSFHIKNNMGNGAGCVKDKALYGSIQGWAIIFKNNRF